VAKILSQDPWLGRGALLSRNAVQVRDAALDDVLALVEIWSDFSRRSPDRLLEEAAVTEATAAVARIAAAPDERLLVAVVDDRVTGAVHLIRAPMSPIYSESAIHVTHLHVRDVDRRHGIGRALVDAAITWAEEKDIGHILAAASTNSRDANRFMARLGLAQIAVVRGSTVSALRAKLPVEPPAAARVGRRHHRGVGQVLAQRRSQRRARARTE
jgi:GNAT superfamily N-acetyltransferase